MVASLGGVGAAVAAAMRRVPRHRFVPSALADEAYDDTPLPLGPARSTISAPHMVALLLEWAELRQGLRVLELGSGSGYLAALIAELVRPTGRVVGVELDESLATESQARLDELGYRGVVSIHAADGRAGWPADAPYDRILVSFATPELFPEWTRQLADPGILVAPVGPATGQVLRRLRRGRAGDRVDDGPGCIFVGLASPHARPK
ncbi:MAG TPA: protein-L-isoaspartate O-methyltransferase [Thermoplasmata archaeon]|nr:protein-L-isoaspartate O-methyltransferase [Thermoplasmata archaeon]